MVKAEMLSLSHSVNSLAQLPVATPDALEGNLLLLSAYPVGTAPTAKDRPVWSCPLPLAQTCIAKPEADVSVVVCVPKDRQLTFRDPPPAPHPSRIGLVLGSWISKTHLGHRE